jgi:hypothetical protein
MNTSSDTNCRHARYKLGAIAILAVAGLALGWDQGQLPRRDTPIDTVGANTTAPDLALYCEIIARVRAGQNYYSAARECIPHYGFPISSPLNWRLPTYAWVFSSLPGPAWIQAALILLSLAAIGLACSAQARTSGVLVAAITALFLFGIAAWSIDGYAYVAQEPWAATLVVISLAAHALGGRPGDRGQAAGDRAHLWRSLAVAAGIAALFFRELALPFCAVAAAVAAWNRRWFEAAGWLTGIVVFFGFFAWHVDQVHAQLAGVAVEGAGGLNQWLRFGGLDFVLLTTRMNKLLFASPAWLLWLYLLASLIGLSQRTDETSRLACLASLAYLLAFAVVGRPENFYWGLLPAPLLAWGAAHGPLALLWASGKRELPGIALPGRLPSSAGP